MNKIKHTDQTNRGKKGPLTVRSSCVLLLQEMHAHTKDKSV